MFQSIPNILYIKRLTLNKKPVSTKTLLIQTMSAYVTIKCGPSQKSRSTSSNSRTLDAYMPKFERKSGGSNRRIVRVKRSVDSNNSFAALAEERRPSRPMGPRNTEANKPTGSWGKRLTVSSDAPVKHTPTRPNTINRVSQKAEKPAARQLTQPCAYCHDKEHIHHIRDCPILAEKNRRKAERSRQEKAARSLKKRLQAEARIAEQVRFAQLKKDQVIVVKESSDSDSSDDEVEEYPALTAAIASGKVTTQRGSNWGPFRRVTFKDDSENLMKPPCDTKVFNKEDAPSAISSDEEEEDEIVLKRSANAWKPKRFWKMPMTAHERQFILDEIAEKEEDLKACNTDSWADDAEIEELTDAIEALKAKLA